MERRAAKMQFDLEVHLRAEQADVLSGRRKARWRDMAFVVVAVGGESVYLRWTAATGKMKLCSMTNDEL